MTSPDKDVAAIEARLTAATPGPWWNYGTWPYEVHGPSDVADKQIVVAGRDCTLADAELVAAAPADIAALLAEVKRLTAKLDRVRELHQVFPEPGMGYTGGNKYGDIEQVCGTCGTPDEYGTPWPCATIRALGEEAGNANSS